MDRARRDRLRRAKRSVDRAGDRYIAEIVAAVEAGETYAEVAFVLGLTRQNVRQIVLRARP